MNRLLTRISRLDSHHRLAISLPIVVISFFALRHWFSLPTTLVGSWIVYTLTVLTLAWITFLMAHPRQIRETARIQDSSRTLISIITIGAAVASLFAVILLLGSVKANASTSISEVSLFRHVALSLVAVICSWLLVHTVFTLRYAHLFYGDKGSLKTPPIGGLDFPGDEEPDYLDFAYFSFIIGMTSQVSDVAITSRRLRRLALVHGVLAFGFNALIVALTINTVSGLL